MSMIAEFNKKMMTDEKLQETVHQILGGKVDAEVLQKLVDLAASEGFTLTLEEVKAYFFPDSTH